MAVRYGLIKDTEHGYNKGRCRKWILPGCCHAEWHEETHIQIDGEYSLWSPSRQKKWQNRGSICHSILILIVLISKQRVWNGMAPKSGKINRYPGSGSCGLVRFGTCKAKINPAQIDFLLQSFTGVRIKHFDLWPKQDDSILLGLFIPVLHPGEY